jgi:carbon monoxide dehydrogenase subunit G
MGGDRYAVELSVAVAAIAGSFKGTVVLAEKVPPNSYTLLVEGTGRQGFVKGDARIRLEPEGDRTKVHVEAQSDVGGMIARVGQRLLEGVARMTMDRFYGCLAEQLRSR